MISSIQHGKASISIKEDTLTSSVFDNLLLLPDNFFWKKYKNHVIKIICLEILAQLNRTNFGRIGILKIQKE
jgi:hypothetical protein